MDSWKQYQDAHKEEFLAELIDLLKIPSISARSENKADMLHCAEVVKQRLAEAGADTVTIYPTQGHPIVYAEKIIELSLWLHRKIADSRIGKTKSRNIH